MVQKVTVAGKELDLDKFRLRNFVNKLNEIGELEIHDEPVALGDLSQIMPVLHPYMGGARGTGHAADYAIVDRPLAYVAPAKALACMVVDMLGDGAAGAREVLARARPRLTREAYLALQRGMARREVYDGGGA